jgi:hypothetical protein
MECHSYTGAAGEVKSTLIFSGHIDSTHECTWWYRYKQYGAHVTIMAELNHSGSFLYS